MRIYIQVGHFIKCKAIPLNICTAQRREDPKGRIFFIKIIGDTFFNLSVLRYDTNELEERIEQMETTIEAAVSNKKSAPILTNLFEEYGVLDPRQWPSGVAYDSIHYLGDLSTLQFFSNKIDEQGTFQGHKIRKIGGNVVLVADPGKPGPSKIPVFQLPEDMHSGEDIHKYIYTVTGVDRYTAVRLLKM